MTKTIVLTVFALPLVATLVLATWTFGYFALPLRMTNEGERLRAVLGIEPGAVVADVGAGTGGLALATATFVGPEGRVYATELDETRRVAIAARATKAGVRHVEVVQARASDTGLPDACCDAIYLRNVFHHIDDRAAFVQSLTRAARPGARIAVIDFVPGTLWFHGANHGVTPEAVREAFRESGWRERERRDDWGGGMFLVVFERTR